MSGGVDSSLCCLRSRFPSQRAFLPSPASLTMARVVVRQLSGPRRLTPSLGGRSLHPSGRVCIYVLESKGRTFCRSGTGGQLPVHQVLRNAAVIHADDVAKPEILKLRFLAKPTQASLGQDGEHAWHICSLQDVRGGDAVLPSDAQQSAKASHVEGVQPSLLA